jgi:hypothetical protein
LGCYAKELCAVAPVGAVLVDQTEESFVHQDRGLQGVARALTPHLIPGDAAQFPVNQRHQPVQRIASAKRHFSQQSGYFSPIVRHTGQHPSRCSVCAFDYPKFLCPYFRVLTRSVQDPQKMRIRQIS